MAAAKPRKSGDILDAVALLVVDMQGKFLDVIEGAPAVVERCGFAIEAARALGLRVIFTEQVPDKLGPTEPRLRALVPNARVFGKRTFSALQADGLTDYLRRQGIYHLMLAGIEIPVCIYQTALHAIDSDFDVTVLSDCVTGRRLDDCLVTLEALTRAHCHVLPAEAVYYSMLGHAGHPRFSNFNAIVKRYAGPGGLDSAPAAAEPPRDFRPELAAPEDRSDAAEDLDLPEEGDEAGGDDTGEGYVGHDEIEHAADGGEDDESAEFGDDTETDADADADAETGDGDSEDAGVGEEESGPGGDRDGDRGGRRRRGRRRRGGARRRRARERAAARGAEGQQGDGAAPREPAPDDRREPAASEQAAPDQVEPPSVASSEPDDDRTSS